MLLNAPIMYELRHFATLNRAAYKTPNDKFQFSTIYDFQQIVPVRRDVFRYLETLPWRLANSYAVAYWSVLLMATYGLILALNELRRVSQGHKVTPSFRVQRFDVFPSDFRRHVRLVSSVVSAGLTVMLIVGVLMMKPHLMDPWLGTQLVVVLSEIVLWLCDLWTERDRFSLRTFTAFCCVYVYWMAVVSIRQTFMMAASQGVCKGMAVLAR